MNLKIINRLISTIIIISNFYFLPVTVTTIQTQGGAMGYGLLILPILLSINFFLITAVLNLIKQFNSSYSLLTINTLGLLWISFWMWVFLTM